MTEAMLHQMIVGCFWGSLATLLICGHVIDAVAVLQRGREQRAGKKRLKRSSARLRAVLAKEA